MPDGWIGRYDFGDYEKDCSLFGRSYPNRNKLKWKNHKKHRVVSKHPLIIRTGFCKRRVIRVTNKINADNRIVFLQGQDPYYNSFGELKQSILKIIKAGNFTSGAIGLAHRGLHIIPAPEYDGDTSVIYSITCGILHHPDPNAFRYAKACLSCAPASWTEVGDDFDMYDFKDSFTIQDQLEYIENWKAKNDRKEIQ